jgi:predicted AAA+ superfamily ATPase
MKRWKFLEELSKYYPTDSMIRNTIPDFKQTDKFHLLECVIYNELIQRGYNVVIVLVYLSGEKSYQVDFVAKGNIHQYYLQISYSLSNDELMNQKLNTFKKIKC